VPAFDEYFPFDFGHGAPATSARWKKMARLFVPDGIVKSGGDQFASSGDDGAPGSRTAKLQATLTGGNVIVSPGAIVIHGYYAELANAVTIPVSSTGLVIGQVDLVYEVVSLEWVAGVTDYNNLIQSETMWQIPLWLVTGTNLQFVGNNTTPGRALGTTTGFFNGGWMPINVGQTKTFNFGKARFSHPCLVFFHAFACFSLYDARYAQNAVWSLDLNWNLPGEILWPTPPTTIEPFFWGGGGGLNGPPWYPVINCSFSCEIWLPAGLYTVGLRVTCGTGAFYITINEIGINMIQLGSISNQ
jgi:hypothetical protein